MSLSGAMHNALSGLYMNGRASELVASNISNVSTPGYARRTLSISSSVLSGSGGVRVDGVVRHSDPLLLSDRRLATADLARQGQTSQFVSSFETLLGTPDVGYSLAGRLAGFENSLITAASRPDAPERLDTAAVSGAALARSLRDASDAVQESRSRADQSITTQVTTMNDLLGQLEEVNAQIISVSAQRGRDATLHDQRQILIDQISEMVPVRTVPRDNNAIALYTTGGAILFDGTAAEIGFEPSYVITPGMDVDGGPLSGLTLNGKDIRTGSDNSPLRGGSLIAQFEIRDELAVEAQSQLDAVARDLISRFEGLAEDTTIGHGDPGLFTDNGAAFDPLDEVGIAGRIQLNADVDPDQGGAAWRLRDGLGAATQGDVGDARLLQAFGAALTQLQPAASGNFGGGAFSAAGLTASLTSQVGSQRLFADQQLGFASAQFNELKERELAGGVDTDSELQRLMVIEQAYAANARIIETVDELMQVLMRI